MQESLTLSSRASGVSKGAPYPSSIGRSRSRSAASVPSASTTMPTPPP